MPAEFVCCCTGGSGEINYFIVITFYFNGPCTSNVAPLDDGERVGYKTSKLVMSFFGTARSLKALLCKTEPCVA